jgi:hypothetical protein
MIISRTAGVTVRVVEPLTPSSVALIVDVPTARPDATPSLAMVATDVEPDAHVTWLVRSCVELSEYVPVAMKGWTSPTGIEGLEGVTEIDSRAAAVTVSKVEPPIPPNMALIVEVPTVNPEANPMDPGLLEMLATAVSLEAQVTWPVRSCVELSE